MKMGAALLVVALGVVAAGCGEATESSRNGSSGPPSAKPDPYSAAVAYVSCLRRHGVPHPDPDRIGDFRLTAADEKRLRRVPRAQRQMAQKTCFRYLKGTVSTKPLSQHAKDRAIKVLKAVARCMKGHGYDLGPPVVRNLPLGRAFFGFSRPDVVPQSKARDNQRVLRICEKRVDLAGKLDSIIADDRGTPNLGDL